MGRRHTHPFSSHRWCALHYHSPRQPSGQFAGNVPASERRNLYGSASRRYGRLKKFLYPGAGRKDHSNGRETNHVLVDQVTFITRNSSGNLRQYGPYGKTGQTHFFVEGYVVGFFGRAGNLLDALGVYYLPPVKRSPQFGGGGGNAFEDPIETKIPPIVSIKELRIRHGNQVDSIGADYEVLGGGSYEGGDHGGSGGKPTVVTLAKGEVIVKMSGKTNNTLVDQLTFTTRKPDGTTATYGPYGKTGRTEFEVDGRIVGFFGRAGNLLDAVGVFYAED